MRHLAVLTASVVLATTARATPLPGWPSASSDVITSALTHAGPEDYAVFDADGTLWSSDIEEAGIAFFERQGWLSLKTLDPVLKPIPVREGESLYGYYRRLCDFDAKLCLPWSAQVFSGQPLGLLKTRLDALWAYRQPIPVTFERDGTRVHETIDAPHIYAAQKALIQALKNKGVRVYIVSASQEELVRAIVSDPRYGLDIPPEDVIGTTTLLHAPNGDISTARRDIARGVSGTARYWSDRRSLVPGVTLWSPLPWQEGKVAAIQAYIDPSRRPLLVAGDSSSDWPMLFYSKSVRIWVNHDADSTKRLKARRAHSVDDTGGAAHWVEVTPGELTQ
jgi:phosphorylcholine phosphatase